MTPPPHRKRFNPPGSAATAAASRLVSASVLDDQQFEIHFRVPQRDYGVAQHVGAVVRRQQDVDAAGLH